MRGFTLIEMLVYMAISAMISTSFASLAFTLSEADTRIRQDMHDEATGLLVLRLAENDFRDGVDVDLAAIAPDAPIQDIAKSETGGMGTFSFTINKKRFSISAYEK